MSCLCPPPQKNPRATRILDSDKPLYQKYFFLSHPHLDLLQISRGCMLFLAPFRTVVFDPSPAQFPISIKAMRHQKFIGWNSRDTPIKSSLTAM